MAWKFVVALCLSSLAFAGQRGQCADVVELRAEPATIRFEAPESSEQLLVYGKLADGRVIDVTREVRFAWAAAGIAEISNTGRIVPIRDGQSQLNVQLGERTASVVVDVSGMSQPTPISFPLEVIPILSKSGCNSGGCH